MHYLGLQERGKLMIEANVEVYEGKSSVFTAVQNDLTVNCLQGKKLTNMRASGKDVQSSNHAGEIYT